MSIGQKQALELSQFVIWALIRLVSPEDLKQFPGKKIILVMDNASYHRQMNTRTTSTMA